MSKLLSISSDDLKSGSLCEACGRIFLNSIQLTNHSATPMETYNACPFCFAKQQDLRLEQSEVKISTTSESEEIPLSTIDDSNTKQTDCPHKFGYLKTRPKNTSVPDDCLTCPKMIQCLL